MNPPVSGRPNRDHHSVGPSRVHGHGDAVAHVVAALLIRLLMCVYGLLMALAGGLGCRRERTSVDRRQTVLLTGTFLSANWIDAHIKPLAASQRCLRVWLVTTLPVPSAEKVCVVYPPRWLRRVLGDVGGRLAMFAWIAARRRPDIVGGFHLQFNAMAASLVGRLAGARTLYFCVGGPLEVLGGGCWAENRVFGLLRRPDATLERWLVRTVATFDTVITMGHRAVEFFRQRGLKTSFHVVSGGIESCRFHPQDEPAAYDMVFVGRLAPIKRVDRFLHVVAEVRKRIPDVRAVVVGDGPLRASLETVANELGLSGAVTFAGHQTDVAAWLGRAKVFVLTSESEGLALSMMEAMTCGLPAVVTDVGDLADLVIDQVNGYLVREDDPVGPMSRKVWNLLSDESRLAAFSDAARSAAQRYSLEAMRQRWDAILRRLASDEMG